MKRIASDHNDPCMYWPQSDKTSRFEFDLASTSRVDEAAGWRAAKFRELGRGGLSGSEGVYHPTCPSCPASEFCVPARINLAHFRMSPLQQSRHDLFRAIVDLEKKPGTYFDPDVFQLYKTYVKERHGDTQTRMKDYTPDQFKEVFSKHAWIFTARLKNGELIAASMVDQHGSDYCAEYQIYNPDWMDIKPGISMTLSLLDIMRKENPDGHLYVGSWSPGSPKLGYKKQFFGTEILSGGQWQLLDRKNPAPPLPLL